MKASCSGVGSISVMCRVGEKVRVTVGPGRACRGLILCVGSSDSVSAMHQCSERQLLYIQLFCLSSFPFLSPTRARHILLEKIYGQSVQVHTFPQGILFTTGQSRTSDGDE